MMTSGSAARLVRAFEPVYRTVVRCAPAGFRRAWGDETLATFRAACLASERRGVPGVMWTAIVEIASLAWIVVSLQLHLTVAPISPGPPRREQPRRRTALMQRLGRDVRTAIRNLGANHLNTGIALATLALGIGVNTSIFSILDSVLWRPVPFRDADRFAALANFNVARKFSYQGMSRMLSAAWRTQTDLFDRVEVYERGSFVYRNTNGAAMVSGAIVSPGLFAMLDVPARAGRWFAEGEGRAGADRLAIVSDTFWRSMLHGDAGAIGRPITLDDADYAIVGVMPATFRFPDERTAIWLPYDLDAPPPDGSGPMRQSVGPAFVPVVRVRAGFVPARLRELIVARGAGLSASTDGTPGVSAVPMSLELSVDDRTERSLVVLGAAVAFLLLIVCANLASLALSRSLARARDFAVRAALGASRADLVRQTFVESLLLGATGAVAGAILAGLLLNVARAVMPDAVTLSTLNPIDLDGRTLACAAALGVVTAVLFGLPPAYFASRTAIADVLRRGGRAIACVGASERLRAALVVAEVAVSMVLLVGAALMTHSLIRLTRADRGLDATGLIALRLGLPAASYADPSARDQFTRLVSERLRHVPGVQAVSIGSVPPETSKVVFGQVHVDGLPEEAGDPAVVPVYEVTPDFFATLRIRIEQGHTFTDHDPEQPAIVSESFAHQHWPNGAAIGGRFEIGQTGLLTVIGIVGDVKRAAPGASTRPSQIYYPVGQTNGLAVPAGRMSMIADYRTLVIRTDDSARVVPSLPAAVHEIDPLVVIWKTDLVEHLFADAIARPRIVFVLMTMFATFGLVLAAAGIYGVLSYLVAARQQEIGIRLALGARPHRVGIAIVRNGLTLTMIGLAVGLASALMLVRTMRTLLFEVEPSDPVSIAAVAAVLLATALLACWRPTRQAMRVDPVNLLREG